MGLFGIDLITIERGIASPVNREIALSVMIVILGIVRVIVIVIVIDGGR